MVSVQVLSQISLLLASLIMPIENQLFVNDDSPDLLEAWNNHFANPVIQVRTFIVIAVRWVAQLIAWTLLGTVWAQIRGDQYNYNINSTVLFNYAVSDTTATQFTIKAASFGVLTIIIWQLLASLGSPIPVPQRVVGGRGRREAHGGEWGWEDSGDVIIEPSTMDSEIKEADDKKFKYYEDSSPVYVPYRVKRQSSPAPTFLEDVLIPALNQNLEPNGIGRNTLINTVVTLAQTLFWMACTLLLPQI